MGHDFHSYVSLHYFTREFEDYVELRAFFVLVKNRELLLSIPSSMGQPLMFGQSILSWVNSHFQWEFQDPKMEVRSYHIFGHILWRYSLKLGLICGRYLQFI